ncbi:hypothetical protein BDB00DRAFT_798500, partial [Zychaea mexicana]|uniref:uncharacterized protein n=1 Tax=Zychaea mexicana TaxID=64656 RepID=UPI0022FF38B1
MAYEEKITILGSTGNIGKLVCLTVSRIFSCSRRSMLRNRNATPGLSIFLGRPAETLEEWIEQKKVFFC